MKQQNWSDLSFMDRYDMVNVKAAVQEEITVNSEQL